MNDTDAALLRLLQTLDRSGYRFVTPTPETHARVVARPARQAATDLAGILGWSIAFERGAIDPEILALLDAADGLEATEDGRWRSRYRVSSLKDRLYLHSAYPTTAQDAVFFGPDSYRFADLIETELQRLPAPQGARIVDIGTGSGVGAIVAASLCPGARVTMTDINPQALLLACINAQAAGVQAKAVESPDLTPVEGELDLVLANPPYIIDEQDRAYRHGGGMRGGEVSLEMTRMGVERLAPGGRFILYTGSAIADGRDELRDALEQLAEERSMTFAYRELDPDVFGEELDRPAYADVDRIAVVAAVLTRP